MPLPRAKSVSELQRLYPRLMAEFEADEREKATREARLTRLRDAGESETEDEELIRFYRDWRS